MRPTRLRLRNFGCYRGEQEIDFTEITSDLFAIAGPIGSGKSTLLDAMTWALYGQTPRLGGKPNEHLFTPGEDDLAVVLEFTSQGGAYRATRTLRRRPSGISPSVKLERRTDDGRWLAMQETEKVKEYEGTLERIVGLDYDGYVRAVMLPQGAFDEFLRGDAAKRQALVKALLKAYTIERMRDLAKAERNGVKNDLERARARLEHEYEGVSREREEELARAVGELEEDLKRIEARVETLEGALQEIETLEGLDRQHRGALQALRAWAEAEPRAETARESVARAEAAASLRPAITTFREREGELADANGIVERAKRAAAEAEAGRDAAKARHDEAVRARDERQGPLRERLVAIEAARRDAALLKKHRAGVDAASRADGGAFDEEALDRAVALLARVGTLRHLETAAAKADAGLRRQEEDLRRRREDLTKRKEDLEAQRESGLKTREAEAKAKAAWERAQVEHQALALRQHLHEGDACPVCESVVERVPPSGDAVDLQGLKDAAERAAARLTEARDAYTRTKEQLDAGRRAVEELAARIEEADRPEAQEARAAHAEALAAFEGLGGSADEIEAALRAERDRQLARLAKRVHGVTGGEEFDALEASIAAALKALDDDVEGAGRRLNAAESGLVGARARLEAAEGTAGSAATRFDAARSRLAEALAASRFETVEEAEAAALEPAEVERLKERLEAHERKRVAAEAERDAAAKALGERTYDAEAHEATKARLKEGREAVSAQARELGKRRQELETLQRRLKDQEALEKTVAQLDERHGVLHNLALSLQADRFEAYVLGHAQADLAMTASEIIHDVTDGRYELTYRDKEFFVRDTWMDAHERSARTLSGGESFIVSLALALALSETIAGQHALGALFLDEGFGTLDAATLDSVTDVLTNLTSRGRMVGVITHVTSLTDRLPARLMVDKKQRGSTAAWDA